MECHTKGSVNHRDSRLCILVWLGLYSTVYRWGTVSQCPYTADTLLRQFGIRLQIRLCNRRLGTPRNKSDHSQDSSRWCRRECSPRSHNTDRKRLRVCCRDSTGRHRGRPQSTYKKRSTVKRPESDSEQCRLQETPIARTHAFLMRWPWAMFCVLFGSACVYFTDDRIT